MKLRVVRSTVEKHMATKKSVAVLEAEVEALRAGLAGAQAELAALQLRVKHDYVERAEYNRVQALLRSTQQFCKKYKDEARPSATSERRAAMDKARAEAMATGRVVTA